MPTSTFRRKPTKYFHRISIGQTAIGAATYGLIHRRGFGFETKDAILLDQRGVQFFVGTYYLAKLVPGHAATMYLGAIADGKGQRLEPGKNYRLRVPKEMPTKEFWSLTVYDMATWVFIYSPQERPGISSFEKSQMKMNPDGNVDL